MSSICSVKIFGDFELALLQLQSLIAVLILLNHHVFHMQGLIGDVRFEGCTKFVCEKDGWNESPARLINIVAI